MVPLSPHSKMAVFVRKEDSECTRSFHFSGRKIEGVDCAQMMAKGYIELYGLSISLMNRDSCRRIDLYYYLPNHLSYLTLLVNIFIINMISLLLTPLHQPRNVEK